MKSKIKNFLAMLLLFKINAAMAQIILPHPILIDRPIVDLSPINIPITTVTENPCDPRIPTAHLRPRCNLAGYGDVETSMTTLGVVKMKYSGEAARIMYLHLTYWVEVNRNAFTSDSTVYGKQIVCKKARSNYNCEMYYSPILSRFLDANFRPFKEINTGRSITGFANSKVILNTRGYHNLKIIGASAQGLFDLMVLRHGKTPTIGTPPINGSTRNRFTTSSDFLVCLTNPQGDNVAECRMMLDSESLMGAMFGSDHPDFESLLHGYIGSPHLIGAWNGGDEDEVPEE